MYYIHLYISRLLSASTLSCCALLINNRKGLGGRSARVLSMLRLIEISSLARSRRARDYAFKAGDTRIFPRYPLDNRFGQYGHHRHRRPTFALSTRLLCKWARVTRRENRMRERETRCCGIVRERKRERVRVRALYFRGSGLRVIYLRFQARSAGIIISASWSFEFARRF